MYSLLLYVAGFGYFYIFYGKLTHVLGLQGDNLCQIAYWEILFHPNMIGSIGASYTKPGQIIVMGLLYELNAFLGGYAFSAGISLIMGLCVWSLLKIATDFGGKVAAVIALPAICGVFLLEFLHVSFSIFLIPIIFTGIRYYFYQPKQKALGRLLLLSSIHFHIQAIATLASIWGGIVLQKRWKELAIFSGIGVISITLWVAIILRVQGSIDRLNSGAAAGYIASYNSYKFNSNTNEKLGYLWHELQSGFSQHYDYVLFLSVFAVFGVAGCIRYGYKQYLNVFSVMLLLIFNVVALGGTLNFERYFALFYALAITIGIGSVVRCIKNVDWKRNVITGVLATFPALSLIAVYDYSLLTKYVNAQKPILKFVVDASNVINNENVPESTRLMTEDDFLYPIMVMQPERYSKLTALQYFNVAPEQERRRILANTDLIWIAMEFYHPCYYLNYTPKESWVSDPFRLMVEKIIENQKDNHLYGFTFEPVEIDEEKLILRVKPE
ncbi:MAG: hypothetical protein PHU01_07605 [Desulfuromonadaceae bacterium]|nr:hypothetical protein [Desulfuromonadaceae bacterium]